MCVCVTHVCLSICIFIYKEFIDVDYTPMPLYIHDKIYIYVCVIIIIIPHLPGEGC